MTKTRVLILAEQCNPEWPSLPVVGYKYALALADQADVTIVTQVRNEANIRKAGRALDRLVFLDTEYVAAPLDRFAKWLRGGDQMARSTDMIMAYAPYIEFERQAWRRFRPDLEAGRFDIVHRITPMSPTLPSYIAGRGRAPFVIGPLNGNLDWPRAFQTEQKREREQLRKLRSLYKHLPYARRTFREAAAVLAAFRHTIDDISWTPHERIVPMPEVGFSSEVFPNTRPAPPFSGKGPFTFLFAGRLVPYKVPEVAVRAFCSSERLRGHRLRIIGDGPELPRLREMAAGAEDRVSFEGHRSQAEVAEAMRASDALVFPSIRDLGAGIVVETMASGALNIVTNYGAPGDLVGRDRGVALPLQPLDGLVAAFREAMHACLDRPGDHARLAANGCAYAWSNYTWDAKALRTVEVYRALASGTPLMTLDHYT